MWLQQSEDYLRIPYPMGKLGIVGRHRGKSHAYGNVNNQTLIDVLSLFIRGANISGFCGNMLDGHAFLEDWIRSPSAPLVQVDYDTLTGYSLSQQPLNSTVNSSWNIPIFYYASSGDGPKREQKIHWLAKDPRCAAFNTLNDTSAVLLKQML